VLDRHAESYRAIRQAALLFFGVALLSLLPPLTVYLDVVVFGNGLAEASLTEFVQTLALLAITFLYAQVAWRHKNRRGFFVLASGFFASMLIREQDQFLDDINDGAWVYPALLVAVCATSYAVIKCGDTIIVPAADFIRSSGFFPAVAGLVILLVFSRVFGSGNLIWEHVMGNNYKHLYKSVIQEGLELLGYLFLLISALRLRVDVQRNSD